MQSCVKEEDSSIGVCCRDPNYVDPWPQNGNGGGNHNHGNKGGNGGGNGNFNLARERFLRNLSL